MVSPGNIQHRACRQRFTGGEPAVPEHWRTPDEVWLDELEAAASRFSAPSRPGAPRG